MTLTDIDRKKRLLYILHLGFVEARLLALRQKHQQIFDLADALELVPRYIEDCGEDDLELIRFALRNYRQRYPDSEYDYPARLEDYDPPDRY